jgi:hypothetical protein
MAWQTAGYLAGLGIRKAVVSAGDKARLRAAMSPAGAATARPLLDIDRVITDGYFFQLGVPWGWRDLYPREVDIAVAQMGLPVVAGVAADRADDAWTGMLVSPFQLEGLGLAELFMNMNEFHRLRFTKAPNGRPLGSPAKILIDGELGLFLHYGFDDDGANRGQPSVPIVPVSTTEGYFARRGQGFRMEFRADSIDHERYLPCLWTMLGSWRWLR